MRPPTPIQLALSSLIKMEHPSLVADLPSPNAAPYTYAWDPLVPLLDPRAAFSPSALLGSVDSTDFLPLTPPESHRQLDPSFTFAGQRLTHLTSRATDAEMQEAETCLSLSQILPPSFSHSPPQTPPPVESTAEITMASIETPPLHLAGGTFSRPTTRQPSKQFSSASSVSSRSHSRSRSPSPARPAKKSRAAPSGPINTKDFIPPDVTGLSKREARLVKNRAAAFLSRQRKREEFELMEKRVQVLEAENARLANLAGSSAESPPKRASSPADEDDEDDEAALEELRSQLAAADERELSLQAELAEMRAAFSRLQTERVSAPPPPTIKAEEHDDQFDPRRASPPSSPKRSSKKLDGGKEKDKSTGSVAFMVLLLSLSLLSTHNAPTPAPVAQSLPTPFSYAHQNQNSFEGMDFDFESILGGSNSMSGANWMGAPNGGLKWDDDDLDFGGIGLGSSLTNPTLSLLPPSRASPASSSSSALTTTAATQKTVELVLRHPDSENTLSSSQPIPDNFDFTFQLPSSSSAPTSFASEENKTVKVSVRRPTATVTAAPSPSAWCQDWSADMDLDKLTTISTTPGENSAKRVTVEVKAHGRGTSSPSASGEDLQLDDIERWEVVVRD